MRSRRKLTPRKRKKIIPEEVETITTSNVVVASKQVLVEEIGVRAVIKLKVIIQTNKRAIKTRRTPAKITREVIRKIVLNNIRKRDQKLVRLIVKSPRFRLLLPKTSVRAI